jgi:putative PIG3 family NAD(P)H quinone oxidoreductase
MKAIGVRNGKGDADALYVEDGVPDPILEKDKVLVRIRAFGLNRMDIMQREDRYPYPLLPESGKIMGVEFSGTVEATGPDCNGSFKPGDEVFGLAYGGAYAQKIAVSEKMLMYKPSNLSWEEAAGIPETFFTAIQAIHLVGGLQPGQTVLIHAGASGVGQSAIQVAKLGGASAIFTTAGTDEKCKLCKSLGADHAINYRTMDFADVVSKETNGRGVDLIIDLVGRDYWHRNTALAAMDSRIVLVAAMSGSQIDNFNLRALLNKRIWVMATTLRTRDAQYQGRLRDTFVEKIMKPLSSGQVKTVVDKVYPWSQISEAHKRMEANVNAGKIICVPEQAKAGVNGTA